MSKRTHKQIRNAILKALSDGKEYTYGYLERKVNTNWQTIRDHCNELKFFNVVSISKKRIKITKEGREILQKSQKFK